MASLCIYLISVCTLSLFLPDVCISESTPTGVFHHSWRHAHSSGHLEYRLWGAVAIRIWFYNIHAIQYLASLCFYQSNIYYPSLFLPVCLSLWILPPPPQVYFITAEDMHIATSPSPAPWSTGCGVRWPSGYDFIIFCVSLCHSVSCFFMPFSMYLISILPSYPPGVFHHSWRHAHSSRHLHPHPVPGVPAVACGGHQDSHTPRFGADGLPGMYISLCFPAAGREHVSLAGKLTIMWTLSCSQETCEH